MGIAYSKKDRRGQHLDERWIAYSGFENSRKWRKGMPRFPECRSHFPKDEHLRLTGPLAITALPPGVTPLYPFEPLAPDREQPSANRCRSGDRRRRSGGLARPKTNG